MPDGWTRLIRLLEPIREQGVATARRLSRCPAEGDDLFQEAVLRAHGKLSSLRDEERFRSWFYSVLLSVHRNRWRGLFRKRFLSMEGALERGFEPRGPDGSTWATERVEAERASRALATLPADQREAIVLFEIDGFSIEEIAGMQGASVSAVKSRLVRGRERLRRHYEKLGFGNRAGVLESGALTLSEGRRS